MKPIDPKDKNEHIPRTDHSAASDMGADTPMLDTISSHLIQAIKKSLEKEDKKAIKKLVEPLHAADLADLIETLKPANREQLVKFLRPTLDPEMLPELDDSVREEVIEYIGIEQLAKALRELDSDDALSIIEYLEPDQQHAVLHTIPAKERASFEQVLTYPEESAGRLMQQEVVVAPPFWTAKETLEYLRKGTDLPESFYEIYVVDPRYHLVGAVSLNTLIKADEDKKLTQLYNEDLRAIPLTMDREEVAYLFHHYALVSAPVVDGKGRLLGMITADDVLEVIEEEAEKDILQLAGVTDTDFHAPFFETFYRRVGWLFIGLVNTMLAVTVIAQFTSSIEKMVALAVLMPVVATMGGNGGMQVLIVTVRAIAMRELRGPNTQRAIIKESLIGALNGLFFALILIGIAILYYDDLGLGFVLAGAMIFNMLWAALAGVFLPIIIDRLGFDPAVASGPLLIASTDVLGFASFLGFATLFLF